MRIYFLFIMVIAAGVAMGVLIGTVVAGSGRPSKGSAQYESRESVPPSTSITSTGGSGPLSAALPEPGKTQATLYGKSPPTSGEPRSSSRSRPSMQGQASKSGQRGPSGSAPLSDHEDGEAKVFQVSRVVPATLEIRRLDDVDDVPSFSRAHLRLVANAIGTVPTDGDPAKVDLNGDHQVDIVDLAIVASKLGGIRSPVLDDVYS